MSFTESLVEQAAIEWFQSLGYSYAFGPDIAFDGTSPERADYKEVVLPGRFRSALHRINPHLKADTLDEVVRRVTRQHTPSLEEQNASFRRWLTRGVDVQVRIDGGVRGDLAWLVDFENPDNNDWLVVNQFTVIEGKYNRRPDVVVFLNGLPVAVIELKNPQDETATLEGAWNQLQTYKSQIPSLFATNEVLAISDGTEARVGSLTAGLEWFGPWRSIDGFDLAPLSAPRLRILIEGLFEKNRFLDYLRNFAFWETDGKSATKKIAGYHQFFAVNKAIEATINATRPEGDKRVGVVWHTQGSGKTVSMAFYAGKIILNPAMENPTLVVLTDRNDLDGQLFGQFAAARDLLPKPEQAESREDLKDLLRRASGGIIFSTLQKFGTPRGGRMPCLSDRRNIVVICDEAHRSHYEFVEGFARNLRDALPDASFIGFTGTPIEAEDKSTPAVFGDYIDTYTIGQSIEDGATVPLHYEARLAKIDLPEDEKPRVDVEFEEVTEGEEESDKQKLKTTWARLESLVGTEKRLGLVAQDIVDHWERRLEIIDGKAMIVCMSRRICVELYQQLVKLRPEWHGEEDEDGEIKVVMTGSASDPPAFQPHIRNKPRQKFIERRFKDPEDPLKIVIVRDMWLTGFDVPCAHTLYLDKPMKGHSLMQAIARVNRVFQDKPSGLVVDYLGLADQLRKAVGTYGGRGGERPGIPVDVALRVLIEKHEVVKSMFHGLDYTRYLTGSASERLETLAVAADHILGSGNGKDAPLPADAGADQDMAAERLAAGWGNGKKRFMDAIAELNKAAAIALHLEGARHLRDDIGFFQAVQKNISKYSTGESGKSSEELSAAIRQIVSGAIASEGVIDIFAAAGLKKPDISILSDEFLETVKDSPHRNLQIELLKKLLNDEIKSQSRRNVVIARKFSEMLERTLIAYQNRTIEAAQVILELIDMAKEMRDAPGRGEELGLTEDEMAFYDALAAHEGVKEVMGDEVLSKIAHDLIETIRGSVTIDWTQKETVRARMRIKIKHLLRKHGYPPDKQDAAVLTVIEQAEQVCRDWAMAV